MGGIFISYRREDSGPYAGRLRDTLSNHFGEGQVFRDIDRINPGQRFARVIEQEVGRCDALLALIGPKWLSVKDEARRRRLDDPQDYLRREIAAALKRSDVLVIPVLIGSSKMPDPADLPPDLAALTECNAVRVTDEGWSDQVPRLIKALEPVVKRDVRSPERTEEPRAQAQPAPQPQPQPWQPGGWQQQPQPAWPQPAGAGGGGPAWRPQPAFTTPTTPQPAPSRSGPPVGVIVGIVAGVAVIAVLAFVALKIFSGFSDTFQDFGPGNPQVVLNPTEGPPGTEVTVTGTGYGNGEIVQILFHATEVGTVQANPDGSFTTQIVIPDTPFRKQTDISANGQNTIRHDSAPFMVK